MVESIEYFKEFFIKNLLKLQEDLFKEPDRLAYFINDLSGELNKLGLQIIRETLEEMDTMIQNSRKRKMFWNIERHDTKQLITSLGTVTFSKTLFVKKDEKDENGKEIMKYLLDGALGLTENQRLSEDAVAKVYEEAVQTSYRRGGEAVNQTDHVSKAAVKDLLHSTVFPPNFTSPGKKKEVKYLYIDADEDHYSLQFQKEKGDIEVNEYGRKKNNAMNKIIYVYEGIEADAPKSKRHHLVNTHYFCREGSCDNKKLWDEVYSYMDASYDLDKVKCVYLNADGGAWIKGGTKMLSGIKYVLDEFHLSKYIRKMTGHMKDTQEDARIEICETIRDKTKKDFDEVVQKLKDCTDSEAIHKKIDHAADYIRSNWAAAQRRLRKKDGVIACSAEGHVSHVLSSRMSSRPMGWSRHGAGQMARLREWQYNGGDMLYLARYQKEVLPMAAGAETEVFSAAEILRSERPDRTKTEKETGKYMEAITHSVSDQVMKQYYFYVNRWF